MRKIFSDDGYLNWDMILELTTPFIFVLGGRGTGKTYGALKKTYEEKIKHLFIRRTQAQSDIIRNPDFSPYKKLNTNLGIHVVCEPITKYNSGFYDGVYDNEKGKYVAVGAPLGYTAALSTFSNVRGFDASDLDWIIWDEFIPERHERPIKNEAMAFFNCYETVNRNRELNGEKPVKAICLANANTVGNPIFMELGLVDRVNRMTETRQQIYIDNERGITVLKLLGDASPIARKKRETALYKLTTGTDFQKMAIDNDFAFEEKSQTGSRPINEYRPLIQIDDLIIYKHKSRSELYVTKHKTGKPQYFSKGETDRKRFKSNNPWIWAEYLQNNIVFETYELEVEFRAYIA